MNAPDSKSDIVARLSGVRIPHSPPPALPEKPPDDLRLCMELQVLTGVPVFCGPGKYSQIRRHLRVHLWVSGRRDAGIFAALGKDMPLSDTEIRKSKVGPKAYKAK